MLKTVSNEVEKKDLGSRVFYELNRLREALGKRGICFTYSLQLNGEFAVLRGKLKYYGFTHEFEETFRFKSFWKNIVEVLLVNVFQTIFPPAKLDSKLAQLLSSPEKVEYEIVGRKVKIIETQKTYPLKPLLETIRNIACTVKTATGLKTVREKLLSILLNSKKTDYTSLNYIAKKLTRTKLAIREMLRGLTGQLFLNGKIDTVDFLKLTRKYGCVVSSGKLLAKIVSEIGEEKLEELKSKMSFYKIELNVKHEEENLNTKLAKIFLPEKLLENLRKQHVNIKIEGIPSNYKLTLYVIPTTKITLTVKNSKIEKVIIENRNKTEELKELSNINIEKLAEKTKEIRKKLIEPLLTL